MGALEDLHSQANQEPRPLWQLWTWEAGPEQLSERELAIRAKTQELAERNNEVEGAISDVWEVAGVTRVSGSERVYPTAEVLLPADPATGKKFSVLLGKSPNGDAWVKYFAVADDGDRVAIPRSERHHTSVFEVEGTTLLGLELRYGTFTWHNDCADYDNTRVEILEVAEDVVGSWESVTQILSQAMRNPELNPEFAAALAQKDAAARERERRVAAFLGGMQKVED